MRENSRKYVGPYLKGHEWQDEELGLYPLGPGKFLKVLRRETIINVLEAFPDLH